MNAAALAPSAVPGCADLLTVEQYARLAGVPAPQARAAVDVARAGGQEIGPRLDIVEQAGALMIRVGSLPEHLRRKWAALAGARAEAPVRAAVREIESRIQDGALDPRRARVAHWRYHVIEPVLASTREGSAERKAAILDLCEQPRTGPDGRRVPRLGANTVYSWIRDYTANGLAGLIPKERSDKGGKRTAITREWDKACPWPRNDDRRALICDSLQRYVRSEWASGAAGWRQIAERASTRLLELSRAHGWNTATLADCAINRRVVEPWRGYRILAVHDRDAKRFFDRFSPAIFRDKSQLLPNMFWFGDVHPLDIAIDVPDPDKPGKSRAIYPRAIAWHDPATNRVRLTLVPLAKYESVRREHVAASFASTVKAWGLPARLYLDNGSEYSWDEMIDGFAAVSRLLEQASPGRALDVRYLTEDDTAVIRAMPYNAKAKAIEGLFSVLETRYFSQIPGWVSGDRLNKRTARVGQDPARFPGTLHDLTGAVQVALDAYHKTPQTGGWLAGRSPNDALRAHVDAGFALYAIDDKALLYAFSEEESRVVDRGYVTWGGIDYYDDALLPWSTRRVSVRVARHDPTKAFCFSAEPKPRLICIAELAPSYAPLDTKGAKERARRAGVLRRTIAEMREHVDLLDLVEQMGRHAAHLPAAPAVPVAGTVEVSDEINQMVAALAARDQDAPRLITKTPAADLDQWGSGGPDPYLDALSGWDQP